jgi:hypothetical protein
MKNNTASSVMNLTVNKLNGCCGRNIIDEQKEFRVKSLTTVAVEGI